MTLEHPAIEPNILELDKARKSAKAGQPLIQSSADFIHDFAPPDYLIDGLLQRRFLYSFTALTGAGKTCVALLWALHVAMGWPIAGRDVEKALVLYFVGENPDDVRMRWIAMAEHFKFDPDTVNVHFIPGAFKISALRARIAREVEALGGVSLIIIDTSAAYFEGDNDNDNVQQLKHAKMFRNLTELPGGPTVLVACHPIKNATNESLLPRGGGAFLNEVDGNLTGAKNGDVTTVHWQGKFRGTEFDPIPFEIVRNITASRLRDSKGRLIKTVIARPLTDKQHSEIEARAHGEADAVLIIMLENEVADIKASIADIAEKAGYGRNQKYKAQRILERLKKGKLVTLERGSYALTDNGRKAAKTAQYDRDTAGARYG